MTAEEIARQLGNASAEGSEWRCSCPLCTHDNLTLRDSGARLLVKCFNGCTNEAVLAELKHRKLYGGMNGAGAERHETQAEREAKAESAEIKRQARIDNALDIWRNSFPAKTTPVETYLGSRLLLDDVPALRFAPAIRHKEANAQFPALLGLVEHTEGGATGIHAVYLNRLDASVRFTTEPRKRSFGVVKGGAVRLAPAGPVLAIAEGIEDALTFMQATGTPSWAAISADGIRSFVPPPLAETGTLILIEDQDANQTGQQAVADAARRLSQAGYTIKIARPTVGKDLNEALLTLGFHESLFTLEDYQPAGNETASETITILTGRGIKMEKIDWLWPSWLARGKFHVLAGGKGAGKSTILFDLMARLTSATTWPDGTPAPQGSALLWSGEDGLADTIVPRFYAAGGDLDRLHLVTTVKDGFGQRPFDPSQDMLKLIQQAEHIPELAFAMIDPVVLALPSRSDSHKNTETRRGLQPLVDFAEQRGIALVGITHFTKGTEDRDPVERVTGSLAFGALPRCVWGASKDDDDVQRRLVRIASNIGSAGGGIEYTVYQAPVPGHDFTAQRIDWGKRLTGNPRELLNAQKQSAQAKAEAFLTDLLRNGAIPQSEVKAAAEAHCHTWATIRRAQEKLGITPRQESKKWVWELPRSHAHHPHRGQASDDC
jgi:putative DNA primase/helicase